MRAKGLLGGVKAVVAAALLAATMVGGPMTAKPAAMLGIDDRGVVKVGKKADLNVIDLDRLTLHAPRMVNDLPSGGKRLTQEADGYLATIVSGQVIMRDGQPTGALPGKIVERATQPIERMAAE